MAQRTPKTPRILYGMARRIGKLGLVNYRTHPTNTQYKVFSFNTEAESDLFRSELEKEGIWFEYDTEEINEGKGYISGSETITTVHLYGVYKNDFNRAQQANFRVSAKFRDPMIKSSLLRYTLLIFFASMLTLAIVGYVKNQQILDQKTEELQQD